jgi:hypothetical protein
MNQKDLIDDLLGFTRELLDINDFDDIKDYFDIVYQKTNELFMLFIINKLEKTFKKVEIDKIALNDFTVRILVSGDYYRVYNIWVNNIRPYNVSAITESETLDMLYRDGMIDDKEYAKLTCDVLIYPIGKDKFNSYTNLINSIELDMENYKGLINNFKLII